MEAKKINYKVFNGLDEVGNGSIIFYSREIYEPEYLPASIIDVCEKISNIGEKTYVEDKVFGERSESLVQTFKTSEFDVDEKDLKVGNYVKVGNFYGLIRSVGGGRVIVDFNHPLAGKVLKVELIFERLIKDFKEGLEEILKIRGIYEKVEKIDFMEKEIVIEFKKNEVFDFERALIEKFKKIFGKETVKMIIKF